MTYRCAGQHTVVQRTHEIGIRAALGAGAATLLRLVLGNGMALALAGLVIGFAGSLTLTRLLSALLFGVSARDPLAMGGAAAVADGRVGARVLQSGTSRGEARSTDRAERILNSEF
jgi:ABC-type antimicrobial peptide transport system permease subunit